MNQYVTKAFNYAKDHKKQIISGLFTFGLIMLNNKYDMLDDNVIDIKQYRSNDAKVEAIKALSRMADGTFNSTTQQKIATQIAEIVKEAK